jgi:cell division protein FtsB
MLEREPKLPFRIPARMQTQTAAFLALGTVVAIIIGALYLAQATVTATTFSELGQLERTLDYLRRENDDVMAQIAQERNLSKLRGRAQSLGFFPALSEDHEYIIVPGYSEVRATPTPTPNPEPTPVYDETFEGWAQAQWDNLVRQFEAWMGRETVE